MASAADRVAEQAQHQAECRGARPVQRHHGVRRHAEQQRARGILLEAAARKVCGGSQRIDAEARCGDGMAGDAQRAEQVVDQRLRILDQRLHQGAVGARVVVRELRCGAVHRAVQQHRVAVVEGMRERCRRVGETEVVMGETAVAVEERRGHQQRLHRAADVVGEAGQGQLRAAHPAAGRGVALVDGDLASRARQGDCRGQPVRARTDHNRVALRRRHPDLHGGHSRAPLPGVAGDVPAAVHPLLMRGRHHGSRR
jgi:hypothetical protein